MELQNGLGLGRDFKEIWFQPPAMNRDTFCSGPHPTWPWSLPGMGGTHNFSGHFVPEPHNLRVKNNFLISYLDLLSVWSHFPLVLPLCALANTLHQKNLQLGNPWQPFFLKNIFTDFLPGKMSFLIYNLRELDITETPWLWPEPRVRGRKGEISSN